MTPIASCNRGQSVIAKQRSDDLDQVSGTGDASRALTCFRMGISITGAVMFILASHETRRPMKLSRKSDYALRALMTLVEHYGKGPVSIRELAEKNDVPRGFLEHIMLDLKSNGVVKSIAGRIGGFILARDPKDVTMGEIVRHFDGVLAPIGCVSATHYVPCSQEGHCRFRRVLLDIRNYTAAKMDQATLAEVYGYHPVTDAEVFSVAFIGGAGI